MKLGQVVHYTLTAMDAEYANRRRADFARQSTTARANWPYGAQAHIGARAVAGDVCAALVVKVADRGRVNLQVFLDGNDVLWVQEVDQGNDQGQVSW